MGRFSEVTTLGGIEIERKMRLIPAAFGGLLLFPFVLHQVLQAPEEPPAKASGDKDGNRDHRAGLVVALRGEVARPDRGATSGLHSHGIRKN